MCCCWGAALRVAPRWQHCSRLMHCRHQWCRQHSLSCSSNSPALDVIASGWPAGGIKVQERALEAMGLLFTARPNLVMDPAVQQIMQQALRPTMPALLKLRGLSNLLNLIKVQLLSH